MIVYTFKVSNLPFDSMMYTEPDFSANTIIDCILIQNYLTMRAQ